MIRNSNNTTNQGETQQSAHHCNNKNGLETIRRLSICTCLGVEVPVAFALVGGVGRGVFHTVHFIVDTLTRAVIRIDEVIE